MFKKQACFLIMLITTASGIASADRQSLTSVALQAESFLADYPYESPYPARFELSKLDERLNLKPCDTRLNVKFTHTQKVMGNTSLTVRCESPVNWQLRIPVRIDIYQDIALTKTAHVKGQSIDVKNIHFKKKNITRLHQGYFGKPDSVERLQAKRNLAANSILNSANVAPQYLVKTGQSVTLLLKINGLEIKTTGLALQSARLGELVKIKNTQSSKIVEGIVMSEGLVTIRL